jgi:hypothetical protein
MNLTPEAKVVAERVIGKATRAYARRCWWADVDDLEQQGWVIACEVWKQQDWPAIGLPKFGACVWVALMHRLSAYLRRQQAPVTIMRSMAENRKRADGTRHGDYHAEAVALAQDRHDSEAPGYVASTPATQEQHAISARAAAKLRDSLLAIQGPDSTMAVAVLCDGAEVSEVAARHGVSNLHVAWAVRLSVKTVVRAESRRQGSEDAVSEIAEAVRQLTA